MRLEISLAVLLLLAGCTTGPQEGQQQLPSPTHSSTADIVVRVQDTELRPVAGVMLVLDNESTTTSRIDGVAVFEDVPAGTHILTASAPGLANVTRGFDSSDEILEIRITLEAKADPYELNYYYAEMACGGETPCEGKRVILEGLATAPLGGFRSGTLSVEWKGGGFMRFALEIAQGGAPLPFPDHQFGWPFEGESPLRFDVPGSALTDPMRLGGVQYRLAIVNATGVTDATNVLVEFAVRSEPGPQPRFPQLHETASATLEFGEGGARTWAFVPGGSMGIIRIEAVLHHDCPVGTRAAPKVIYRDPAGALVERDLWPGEPDYQCGVAVAVPPFAATRDQSPLFLWDAAGWTAEVVGACTCSLALRILEG